MAAAWDGHVDDVDEHSREATTALLDRRGAPSRATACWSSRRDRAVWEACGPSSSDPPARSC